MRELKFRAWDKEQKKMVDDICIMSSGALERITCHKEYDKRLDDLDKTAHWGVVDFTDFYAIECCEIMQFTGLLDRTGKEIYEGDVLEGNNGIKAVVEWTQEFGRWSMRWSDRSTTPISWHVKHAIVIGNIHEMEEEGGQNG